MIIKVDIRENDLLQKINNLITTVNSFKNITVKSEVLPIGDIIICDDKESKMCLGPVPLKGSPDGLKAAISWAAMAEKPAAPVLKSILKPTIKNTPQIASKSWADYSDSEEEEEEIQHAPLVRTYFVHNAPLYYDSRSASTDDDW